MHKIVLSMICISVMLLFSANASAVEFSPGFATPDGAGYTATIDTGVAVAASEHQCNGCHAVKVTQSFKMQSIGGDPNLNEPKSYGSEVASISPVNMITANYGNHEVAWPA